MMLNAILHPRSLHMLERVMVRVGLGRLSPALDEFADRLAVFRGRPRLFLGLFVVALAVVRTAGPKFLSDDPLAREPETQDASAAQPWDIDLFYDLTYQLFVTPRRVPAYVRAQNVNTIDEVPDSSWFTNRVGTRPVTIEEAVRVPVVGPAPVPTQWTLTREKSAGAAPGFTAQDAKGETYFISFDTPDYPEAAMDS